MPDKRQHRGPHPQDTRLFAPESLERLQGAVADYSMLLSRGYAPASSLKLVGDRFNLVQRQRLAVMRAACSDHQLEGRWQRRAGIRAINGMPLVACSVIVSKPVSV